MSPCVWSLIIICVGLSYKAILVEGQATCQCVCSNNDFEATGIESKKKGAGKPGWPVEKPASPVGKPGSPVGKPGSPVGKPDKPVETPGSKPGKPDGQSPAGSTGEHSPGSMGIKPSGSTDKEHNATNSKPAALKLDEPPTIRPKTSPRTLASVRPKRKPSRVTKKPARPSIFKRPIVINGYIDTLINAGLLGHGIADLITRNIDERNKANPDEKYYVAEDMKKVFEIKLDENKKVIADLQRQISELTTENKDERKTLEENLITQESIDDELTIAFNQIDTYQEQVE